jgi:hypothetical protein
MLDRTEADPVSRFRCPRIEGYCSRAGVTPGETLEIKVSANPPSRFTLDLYRMGYYGGTGARHVTSFGPLRADTQPDPPIGPERARECRWETALSLTIPDDWTSGVYLGKLTTVPDGWQSYIIFIVRDRRLADFLFQCSTNTWQAYNRWPDHFSLYDDGEKEWYWGPGARVSYDRPYARYCQILDAPLSTGSGEFLLWEFPLAFWMEREGFDVTYSTNVDTHADPEAILRARTFLSVGHDEYWSPEMFAHVQTAIDSGVNAAFLCGNSAYGVTPMDVSSSGEPRRTLSRIGIFGPPEERVFAAFPEMRKFQVFGPDAARLMGVRSTWPIMGGGDWTCANGGHWLFEGTGMRTGDSIPGLVGWEFHGAPADLPGLEIVAAGMTQNGSNHEGAYASVLFPGPKGNLIFNAATIWWSDGLSEPPGYVRPAAYTQPQGPDPRVERITRNLFHRMRSVG